MDVTEIFKSSIASIPFQSFADFANKLLLFQQESGFIFRKRDAIKLPPISPDFCRLTYKRVYYVCIHYGSYKSTAADPLKHRTIRSDCPSAFYLLMKDGVLRVKTFKMIHNHPPEPEVVKRKRMLKHCQESRIHLIDCHEGMTSFSPSVKVMAARRKRLGPLLRQLESLLLVSSSEIYRDGVGRLRTLIDLLHTSENL